MSRRMMMRTVQQSGGGGGTAWTPANATQDVWIEGRYRTLSGSNIIQLTDQSGNARHFDTSVTGTAPTIVSAGLNGLDYVDFAGGQALQLTTAINITNIAYLAYPGRTGSNDTGWNNGLLGHGINTGYSYVGMSQGSIGTRNEGGTQTYLNGIFTNWKIVLIDVVNNNISVDGANFAYTASHTTINGLKFLGLRQNNTNQSFIGQVAAVILNYTVADKQKYEGWLAHEYGLTANLPADHPYKSSAPTV